MQMRRFASLAVFTLAVLISAAGCNHEKGAVDAVCTADCTGKCEGDDGCGGSCSCDPPLSNASCKGACAPHESCVGGQCICEPDCKGKACLPDGCGGACACPDDLVQNAQGEWVSKDDCHDDCSTAGWQCGAVCGQTCGEGCASGKSCVIGVCSGDFCDSVACNVDVSCSDCPLQLRLADKRTVDGRLLEATVTLEFAPRENAPAPRIGDFRIEANRDVQLLSLEVGDAALSAGKVFFEDTQTGMPFRRRPDGSIQAMLFSVGNTNELPAGRVATLRFAVGSAEATSFRLVRRVETLAPSLVDSELQASKYDQGLKVEP